MTRTQNTTADSHLDPPSHSSARRVVVIEVNEIPLSLLKWHGERHPSSFIAELLTTGAAVTETQVYPEADRELYPSQTWATLATGVPYEKHQVYWYGDPKPPEFPLYWQHAARHRSVGIVGSLHSSPLRTQGDQPGLRFALPDPFASDADARPRSLSSLQRFNLAMTQANSRAVANRFPAADYLRGLRVLPRVGVRASTAARLARLAASVATGRVPRERLRTGQFLLLADVFARLLDEHDPDLAVFFTNHLAAAMHRYWPASFPRDWDNHPYGPDWIERFSDEIPVALHALDRFLAETWNRCLSTDRILVVVSSMGQEGGGEVDEGGPVALVVDDGEQLARRLGVDGRFRIRQAMAPHLTMQFDTEEGAVKAEARLTPIRLNQRPVIVHRAGDTVTLTYHLGSRADAVDINGRDHEPGELGFRSVAVEEHKAGRHMPYGVLLWADPRGVRSRVPQRPVDLVEVAPALLQALGVPPLPHHREPSIRLTAD